MTHGFKHLHDCPTTIPVPASLIPRPLGTMIMQRHTQRCGDLLPEPRRPDQPQPSTPARDLAPLRAGPPWLVALGIRPVRPAIHPVVGSMDNGLQRRRRDRKRHLFLSPGQPLPPIGHEARGVDREEPSVGPAPDHRHRVARPRATLTQQMQADLAWLRRTLGTRRPAGQIRLPFPGLVLPVGPDDELRLALRVLVMTCSLVLQRNTLEGR